MKDFFRTNGAMFINQRRVKFAATDDESFGLPEDVGGSGGGGSTVGTPLPVGKPTGTVMGGGDTGLITEPLPAPVAPAPSPTTPEPVASSPAPSTAPAPGPLTADCDALYQQIINAEKTLASSKVTPDAYAQMQADINAMKSRYESSGCKYPLSHPITELGNIIESLVPPIVNATTPPPVPAISTINTTVIPSGIGKTAAPSSSGGAAGGGGASGAGTPEKKKFNWWYVVVGGLLAFTGYQTYKMS